MYHFFILSFDILRYTLQEKMKNDHIINYCTIGMFTFKWENNSTFFINNKKYISNYVVFKSVVYWRDSKYVGFGFCMYTSGPVIMNDWRFQIDIVRYSTYGSIRHSLFRRFHPFKCSFESI